MMQHEPAISTPTAAAVIPALRRASAETGVNFNFLLEQARTESSLNPKAQAGTSSARGLFQFLDSTWLEMIEKHGARHGLAAAAASISRDGTGKPLVHNAAQRSAILQLREDPYISGLMAGELARDNTAILKQQLGREIRPTELYMAHFLGASGAGTFLSELQENPDLKASQILPAAARSNRTVFYKSGQALSLDQVFTHFQDKFTGPVPTPGTHLHVSKKGKTAEASFAGQAAILAAGQTLQPGTGDATDLPETIKRQVRTPTYTPKQFRQPTDYAATTLTAATLMSLQMLQSIALPSGEEPARTTRVWRA